MEIRDSELRQGPDGTSRTCESRDSIQTSLSGVTADGSRSYGEWSTGEEVWGCRDLRGIVGTVPTVLTEVGGGWGFCPSLAESDRVSSTTPPSPFSAWEDVSWRGRPSRLPVTGGVRPWWYQIWGSPDLRHLVKEEGKVSQTPQPLLPFPLLTVAASLPQDSVE